MNENLHPAQFTGDLDIRRIEDKSHDGRGTWRMLDNYGYFSALLQLLIVVPKGFINDLASVPRLPFIYLLAGGLGHGAAVVHDWLYTTHLCSRKTADAIFYEALVTLGMEPWRAWMMWSGVRMFGASAWDRPGQEQPPEVQEEISKIQAFQDGADSESGPDILEPAATFTESEHAASS